MTARNRDLAQLLEGRPVIAILRGMDAPSAISIAERVWDRGIGIVEVPVQGAESLNTLRALIHVAQERGEVIGAGTITETDLAKRVSDEGASFTVAPGLDRIVLDASVNCGMPHLPGVATASEVQQALRWGCTLLKAFPASSLSPSWIREMKGPFPQARFVATGGIVAENAAPFIAAGAVALGIGSALRSAQTAEKIFDAVEEALTAAAPRHHEVLPTSERLDTHARLN